jgi:hypothetical protein
MPTLECTSGKEGSASTVVDSTAESMRAGEEIGRITQF